MTTFKSFTVLFFILVSTASTYILFLKVFCSINILIYLLWSLWRLIIVGYVVITKTFCKFSENWNSSFRCFLWNLCALMQILWLPTSRYTVTSVHLYLKKPEIRLNLSSSCTLSSPTNIIFLVNQIKSEKLVDTLCGFFITLIAANFQLIK